MGRRVVECSYDADNKIWKVSHQDSRGSMRVTRAGHILSSAPLRELAHCLRPRLSSDAQAAASALRYRDFLTVALIVKDRGGFTDNWVYVHDPGVKVGRVQNYKSWSPEMVPDSSLACYGLEYFCFEGDGLWNSPDEALLALAREELVRIGLVAAADVRDGYVVRQRKAYPVYDDSYAAHVEVLRREMQELFPTLHLAGRNGMHKYDNQDHAMMTALLCVRNIVAGRRLYDPWQVNQDAEYIEEGAKKEQEVNGLRLVPRRVRETADPSPRPAALGRNASQLPGRVA
jgi:protoporphyrinogen oxidase